MGELVELSRMSARQRRNFRPFTIDHFRAYVSRLVFDDEQHHELERWQLDFVREVFRGPDQAREAWLVVPEENGKTTLIALLALYGCDWTPQPWIPVGAHSRDQARVLYTQAKGFVVNTPGVERRFQCLDGYREIRSRRNGGRGIVVCPWDPDSNDGAIPCPYAVVDELHRHDDLSLYRLWKGKLRKRGAQILAISTAGEPGGEFEDARDRIRQSCTERWRRHGGTRYRGRGLSMWEYRLDRPEDCMDPVKVARVNPLSTITPDTLAADLESPTFDVGDWKRLKCNLPARLTHAAITDDEWAGAAAPERAIPEGQRVDVGLDVGWKHDTTAIVPLWRGPDYRLLGEALVLVPPRDGSSLHPDRIKEKFLELTARNPVDAVVMDMTDAEDIAAWLEDELGLTVVERPQSNDLHVVDYQNFMRGLRTRELRHVQRCPLLTRHAMNAVARRLPRGQTRFDRPTSSRSASRQDVRVVDALTAAGMVNTHAAAAPATVDLSAYRITTL